MLHIIFFFNDTATTEIYTLSLHDALPIYLHTGSFSRRRQPRSARVAWPSALGAHDGCQHRMASGRALGHCGWRLLRSEEHTSELQSRQYLVCRLLLEKKKYNITTVSHNRR